jgi:hypothetical protein
MFVDFLKDQPFKMYSVDKKDLDLLRYFIPEYTIYDKDTLPAFLPDNKKVLYLTFSEPILRRSNIINISLAGNKKLFDRDIILGLFIDLYKIPKKYHDSFLECDIEEFWIYLKLLTVDVKPIDIFEVSTNRKYSLLDLYCNFYSEFTLMYSIYRGIDLNYKIIFSAIVSFVLRAKDLDPNKTITKSNFIKVLYTNKKYIPEIQIYMDIYLRSEQSESDFLAFLASISSERFIVK